MFIYVLRRLLWGVVVLLVISFIVFALMHSVPGGPFDREKKLPQSIIANLEAYYGLDAPLWEQYLDYIWGLIRFDLGPSYSSRSRTVNDIITSHFPVSAQLGALAFSLAVLIGIPLGIISALKQNTFADYLSMSIAIMGISIPNIALGPLLIWGLGLKLHLLPVARWGSIEQMIMPVITLGMSNSALVARLTRASILQVIREDYIRTARAKGLSERKVALYHTLRNALIPVVTVLGPLFAFLVTGTLIVEQIFAIPGLGRYFVTSITNRDYPVIMGVTLLLSSVIVLMNLVVDIIYSWLDPRIKYS